MADNTWNPTRVRGVRPGKKFWTQVSGKQQLYKETIQ
uniref:Uncharacterized protein n=1 Tax=Arundo donax TaxID=35708 RepID=A0A0A8YQR9_ARUDO